MKECCICADTITNKTEVTCKNCLKKINEDSRELRQAEIDYEKKCWDKHLSYQLYGIELGGKNSRIELMKKCKLLIRALNDIDTDTNDGWMREIRMMIATIQMMCEEETGYEIDKNGGIE